MIQTRHDGLCQVQSGARVGWVHMRILKEVPQPLTTPRTHPPVGQPVSTHPHSSSPATPATPIPGVERVVTVHFSNKGYGFAMRGVKGERKYILHV